ncbi:hypothetical protein ANN_17367, partial [Periplaneta americana]
IQSNRTMKRVVIKDDDEELFDIPLQPVLYIHYKRMSKEIHRMVKQQGIGFWIQFVTSFRSFMFNQNFYFGAQSAEAELYEKAFIDMLQMLTEKDRFKEFTPLIESLKQLHMMFESLFGTTLSSVNYFRAYLVSGLRKPFAAIPLYTRFVSAITLLYQRWRHAPRIKARTSPAQWLPPDHWAEEYYGGPTTYERYLLDQWGNRLYRLVRVEKDVMKLFIALGQENSGDTENQNQAEENGFHGRRGRRRRRRRWRRRNNGDGPRLQQTTGTINETELPNMREKTEEFRAMSDVSSVQNHVTNDLRNAENERDNRMNVQTEEETPLPSSSVGADGDKKTIETKRTDTFRYDKLFSFGKREGDANSPGTSNSRSSYMEREARDGKNDNILKDSSEEEFTTNRNGATNTPKSNTFRYDRLFKFSSDANVHRTSEVVNEMNDAKEKTGQKNTSPHDEKNTASDTKSGKSFFDYNRMFKFRSENNTGEIEKENNIDSSNAEQKNEQSKNKVPSSKDGKFNESTQKKEESKQRDFFRYDKLFTFSTNKQNGSEKNNNKSKDYDPEEVYYSCDSDEEYDDYSENEDEDIEDESSEFNGYQRVLLHKCSNCNVLEKRPGVYKMCVKCKRENVHVPKVYCGSHCGRKYEYYYKNYYVAFAIM